MIIRINELKNKIGLSPATIYRLIEQDEFPRQIKLGQRAVGWKVSDIEHWVESLPKTNEAA